MFYVVVYVFGIMAVLLMTMLYLAIHIQKSFFSDEGYLTHTLPVSPTQLLLSKIFIYWVWTILDLIFVAASIAILLVNKETWPAIVYGFREMWHTLTSLSGLSDILNNIVYLLSLCIEFFHLLHRAFDLRCLPRKPVQDPQSYGVRVIFLWYYNFMQYRRPYYYKYYPSGRIRNRNDDHTCR